MRRFVNLVLQKWCGRGDSSSIIYSLHRLDVADHLFYPSTADAEKTKAEAANKEDGGAAADWPPSIQRLRQLPAPTMTFKAASRALQVDAGVRFFALLSPRDSDGKILSSNKLGHSTLYDTDANCVSSMPVIAGQLGCHPITISLSRPDAPDDSDLPQDLYVMHSSANNTYWDTCFGVLRFGGDDLRLRNEAWCWDPLPAPPLGTCTPIFSHAVVDGGRAICVSAQAVPGYGPSPATDGTYCFDTVKREWKRAGDWMLPFEGGAEHVLVPGLGDLWLGFTNRGRNLCAASGLSAAVETETAPALRHVWRDACKVPANWMPTRPQLVDLGGGRFCIARTCMVMADEEYEEYSGPGIAVAVLSGIELLTGGGDSDRPPGSIDIVEHKSVGYICRSGSKISWVM